MRDNNDNTDEQVPEPEIDFDVEDITNGGGDIDPLDSVDADDDGEDDAWMNESLDVPGFDAEDDADEPEYIETDIEQDNTVLEGEGPFTVERSRMVPDDASWAYSRVREMYNDRDYSDGNARKRAIKWINNNFDIVRNNDRSDAENTVLWRYDADENRWKEDGNQYLKDIINEIDPDRQGPETDRIIELYGSRYNQNEDYWDQGDMMIPAENGIIDLEGAELDDNGELIPDSVELRDHGPSWGNTYTLHASWDPDTADLDALSEWLNGSVREQSEIDLLYQFIGHAIHGGYPATGMLFITGEGGGGKSVFLDSVRQLVGSDNTSSKSLQEIEENKFRLQRVLNSKLNIDDDLQGTKLDTVERVKKMSAGGTLTVSRLYKSDIDLTNSATLMFAANSPPALPSHDRAMGRRVYSVEFVSEYVKNPDPENPYQHQRLPMKDVRERYQSPEMLSALLFRAVEWLQQILDNNGEFVTDETWQERLEKYSGQSDPIMSFAAECLEDDPDGVVCADDIKSVYDAFAVENNHPGKTKKLIGKTLSKNPSLQFTKGRTRKWSDEADQHTVYRGVSFTQRGFELLPDTASWENYHDQLPEGFGADDDEPEETPSETRSDGADDDEPEETPSETRSDVEQVTERVIERCASIDPDLQRSTVIARTAGTYDTDPEVVADAVDKLVEQGDLIEVGTTDDGEPIFEVNR